MKHWRMSLIMLITWMNGTDRMTGVELMLSRIGHKEAISDLSVGPFQLGYEGAGFPLGDQHPHIPP